MEELSPNINQEEAKPSFKERIQIFIKHCLDVRNSSKVTFVVGVLQALVGLLALLFYGLEEIGVDSVALTAEDRAALGIAFNDGQLGELQNQFVGMFVFFFSVFLVIVGIIIAYYSFNYITTKHRIKVTNTIPILLIFAVGFSVLTFVFEIIYLMQFSNGTFAGYYSQQYLAGFVITFILQWLVNIFSIAPIYYLFKNSEKLFISQYKVRGEEE